MEAGVAYRFSLLSGVRVVFDDILNSERSVLSGICGKGTVPAVHIFQAGPGRAIQNPRHVGTSQNADFLRFHERLAFTDICIQLFLPELPIAVLLAQLVFRAQHSVPQNVQGVLGR